jgi:hypothetical protein
MLTIVKLGLLLAASETVGARLAAGQADSLEIRRDIREIEGAIGRIADRGAALFWLAGRHAELGERDTAVALLRAAGALGQGIDPSRAPSLSSLTRAPGFAALVTQARRAHGVVHRGRVGFTIEEADLIPEGLAYDSVLKVFYAGSELKHKIIKVTLAGTASSFVPPTRYGLAPVGGVRVDYSDHSLWAATDGPETVHFNSRGELVERFSVRTPGPHILNDLVVRNPDQVYLTDSRANEVYRLDRRSGTFTALRLHRPLRVPNGITLSPDNKLLYAGDYLGVVIVDLENGASLDLPPSAKTTLAGIDGLYWYRGSLIGVQYGTGWFRVMRWRLSPDGRRVVSAETLESGTSLVEETTTGAIVGDRFYFFANTGIPNWKDDTIIDRKKLRPVRVAVVSLGPP